MESPHSVYRQIRAERTWRPLGKMSWWRIVLGLALLLLVFLFLVALLRVKKPFYFLSTTTLLGMFLFLSIWECNSRYLYSLIPCFLINSLEGTRILSHWLVRHSS